MKILQINCHPDFDNTAHAAVALANSGLSDLTAKFPDAEIDTLNLYAPDFDLPRIDKNFISATELTTRGRELIEQWKAADLIFIYSPLHNFNITSRLKDYLDNVMIARETYRYTETGSVGMMSDATTKVTFILTSGSDYSTNYRYINMDIAPQFMRVALSVMGINEMKLIRAQGLDLLGADKPSIVENAKRELADYIKQL